jgi:hypothetical protein
LEFILPTAQPDWSRSKLYDTNNNLSVDCKSTRWPSRA